MKTKEEGLVPVSTNIGRVNRTSTPWLQAVNQVLLAWANHDKVWRLRHLKVARNLKSFKVLRFRLCLVLLSAASGFLFGMLIVRFGCFLLWTDCNKGEQLMGKFCAGLSQRPSYMTTGLCRQKCCEDPFCTVWEFGLGSGCWHGVQNITYCVNNNEWVLSMLAGERFVGQWHHFDQFNKVRIILVWFYFVYFRKTNKSCQRQYRCV